MINTPYISVFQQKTFLFGLQGYQITLLCPNDCGGERSSVKLRTSSVSNPYGNNEKKSSTNLFGLANLICQIDFYFELEHIAYSLNRS
jgi:hypothetical protein